MAGSIHVLRTELARTVSGLRVSISEKGLARTGGRVLAVAGGQLAFPITRSRRQDERFTIGGEQLPYTYARYNNAFLNERTVEISIAKWFLAGGTGRMLEIGNVLPHYGVTGHTVLDKYELIPGVINEDIVDFAPERPYDSVVAISTLEHVGWDEEPRRPEKVFKAFEAVRSFSTSSGRVLVTTPIGHNTALDGGLRSGELSLPVEHWMVRRNRRNEWIETDREDALSRSYGLPYTGANGLYVGMVKG